MIELSRRLIEPGTPRRAAVHRNDAALISHQGDAPRVVRTDPEILIIIAAGGATQRGPMNTAVGRFHGDDAGAVQNVGVGRIYFDYGQIAAADAQRGTRIGGGAGPGLAAIIGSINAEP